MQESTHRPASRSMAGGQILGEPTHEVQRLAGPQVERSTGRHTESKMNSCILSAHG